MILINGKQMSPCICAKARFALTMTKVKPTNKKTCSIDYWMLIVNHSGGQADKDKRTIRQALQMTYLIGK